MSGNPLLLRSIVETLPRFAYRFANEADLHCGISEVLTGAGIPFEHEFVANAQDRFDFLVDSSIVIEAKVKGSMNPAMRQCARYLQNADVSAVVLVTNLLWRGTEKHTHILTGKPLQIIRLRGSAF